MIRNYIPEDLRENNRNKLRREKKEREISYSQRRKEGERETRTEAGKKTLRK